MSVSAVLQRNQKLVMYYKAEPRFGACAFYNRISSLCFNYLSAARSFSRILPTLPHTLRMLWNEAMESIAPPPEIDPKAKGRKRPDDKTPAAKRSKFSEGEVVLSAAPAAEDAQPRAVDAGMASTVYQIYHRAFE